MTRLRPALLLAGALVLLSSLYLPWQQSLCPAGSAGPVACRTVDASSSQVGSALAVFALLLAAVAAAALVRPGRCDRLLELCALLAGYFGLAVGAETRSLRYEQLYGGHAHYASGAYVGGAGVIVVLVAVAARRWERRWFTGARAVTLVLAAGLLVSLLLPWERYLGFTDVGVLASPAVVAAVLAICVVAGRGNRLALAVASALFTGAAITPLPAGVQHAYGAWAGLGFALGLVVVALPRPGISRPARPPAFAVAGAAAAALLIVSLFLPWQQACAPGSDGGCFSTNGWATLPGSAAAVLALALAFVLLAPRPRGAPLIELAAGIGLFVATLGFELFEGTATGAHYGFGYGSTLGFAAGAFLVALVLVRVRPRAFDRDDVLRVLPVAACLAYATLVVLPWWGVLSFSAQRALQLGPFSRWLMVVGVLAGIRLLGLWVRRASDLRLVLLPLAMLALSALDLIGFRNVGIGWGGDSVVGLCLLLAFLGRIEQRGGLRNFQVPEILRVDRL